MNPSQVREENRVWALVAYGLAPLGALLPGADDPALKRHARQALLAGVVGVAASLVLSLIPGRWAARPCRWLPRSGSTWSTAACGPTRARRWRSPSSAASWSRLSASTCQGADPVGALSEAD